MISCYNFMVDDGGGGNRFIIIIHWAAVSVSVWMWVWLNRCEWIQIGEAYNCVYARWIAGTRILRRSLQSIVFRFRFIESMIMNWLEIIGLISDCEKCNEECVWCCGLRISINRIKNSIASCISSTFLAVEGKRSSHSMQQFNCIWIICVCLCVSVAG